MALKNQGGLEKKWLALKAKKLVLKAKSGFNVALKSFWLFGKHDILKSGLNPDDPFLTSHPTAQSCETRWSVLEYLDCQSGQFVFIY